MTSSIAGAAVVTFASALADNQRESVVAEIPLRARPGRITRDDRCLFSFAVSPT